MILLFFMLTIGICYSKIIHMNTL
ncbi:hypothetical protein IM043_gp035 [Bacillus phage SPG24]|nr:hypothetical protein IM043_gp035 [Bacillus phage SPG24]